MQRELGKRYQIQSELGEGGMGTVYLAFDSQTNQLVALKQLKSEVAKPEIIERFKREAQALSELNHPNIVKLLDSFEEDKQHYLIMEYIAGGDLRQLLHKGKLSPQRSLNIAIDLADALTRAHRLNIIHRDLKPANILIAEDESIRLTDFGIAYRPNLKRVTLTDMVIGTLDYLAPEQLQGATLDQRADIWAFGVMLFEMLTGRPPFSTPNYLTTLQAIASAPIPDLEALVPDAPIAMIDLIYRMLERDPQARISSVRHIGAALEDILQGREAASRFANPLPEIQKRPKHSLPVPTNPFVGREHELSELSRLLQNPDIRFISIVAAGGMGKTRLALALGEQLFEQYEHGVYFVELSALAETEHIIPAIAKTIGFQFQNDGREAKEQILDYISSREMLLILDNFEHLLEAGALVPEFIQAAPNLKILVTSRQRLEQYGESLFHLGGMDFPSWESPADALNYAAVKLFLNSALRVKADFALKPENIDAVARICRLVSGMPLGIVLAASWLEMLKPEEIAGELQKSFDFLSNDAQHIRERQRNMRSILEYSWQQMNTAEQAVFMKLGIFRGGFSREAAETLAGANLRLLLSLISKSLLWRDANTGRYQIHELLRQFAEEQLQSQSWAQEAYEAHASYFIRFMEAQWELLKGARQGQALEAVEHDFDNIYAAWNFYVHSGKAIELCHAAKALYFHADRRTHRLQTALQILEKAIQVLDLMPDSTEQAISLGIMRAAYSRLMYAAGKYAEAYRLALQALTILNEHDCPEEAIIAYESASQAALFIKKFSETLEYAKQGLAIARANQHDWGEAYCLYMIGIAYLNLEDFEKALEMGDEALLIAEKLADTSKIASIQGILRGGSLRFLERNHEAETAMRAALQDFLSIGELWGAAYMCSRLSWTAFRRRNHVEAIQLMVQCAHYRLLARQDWITIPQLPTMAALFIDVEEFETAAKLLGAASRFDYLAEQVQEMRDEFEAKMDSGSFNAAWEEGANLGFEKCLIAIIEQYESA